MSRRRRSRAHRLAAVLAVPVLLSGCGEDDPAAAYCAAVEEHQGELGELLGDAGPDALLGARGVFAELRAEAPEDLSDEWALLVGRLDALQQALDEAGVAAADYDHGAPPAGLAAAEAAAIEAAATELGSAETAAALAGLEQQARDVCHTPLVL